MQVNGRVGWKPGKGDRGMTGHEVVRLVGANGEL